MTDLISRLRDARPTTTELDALWSPADRAARLDEVLATRSPRRAPRGRRTAVLAAAATVALAVVVPTALDPGDATAADLRALATSAVRYDGPVLAEGRWLHERSHSVQRDLTTTGAPVLDRDRESWTAWDGSVVVVEDRDEPGLDAPVRVQAAPVASLEDPTPAWAATLPADAEGLRRYLDPRVSGSTSHAEALFEALTGLATSRTLPPRTLAAAFEALAEVPGVRTRDTVVDGRPAVEVRLDEASTSSSDAVVVDRASGQVLVERQRSAQSDHRSTTELSEVVDGVPADVAAAFAGDAAADR